MSNTAKRRDGKAPVDWDPEDIKAAVRKKHPGSTLAKLSRDHGYAASAGSMVLRQPWPRLEAIIAEFLGVSPWKIWPSRYVNQKPKARAWSRAEHAA